MNLRSLGTHITAPALVISIAFSSSQVSSGAQSNSASRVAAEMAKGRLSSTESKPGDSVMVRLQEDLKSNGQVVLKKGTLITGIVRTIGRSDPKAHAQSMIEIDWQVPAAETRTGQSMSIALQSVTQLTPAYRGEAADSFREDLMKPAARPARASSDGAALGEVVAAVAANPALLSMPSVIAVDHQTSSAIENGLDSSAPGQLFKVGRGELAAAGGAHESVDLFSHFNNDTVITSPSRSFEISSGAQLQFLVGIRK